MKFLLNKCQLSNWFCYPNEMHSDVSYIICISRCAWFFLCNVGVRSCYDEGKRVAETLMFDYHRQHGVGKNLATYTVPRLLIIFLIAGFNHLLRSFFFGKIIHNYSISLHCRCLSRLFSPPNSSTIFLNHLPILHQRSELRGFSTPTGHAWISTMAAWSATS